MVNSHQAFGQKHCLVIDIIMALVSIMIGEAGEKLMARTIILKKVFVLKVVGSYYLKTRKTKTGIISTKMVLVIKQ